MNEELKPCPFCGGRAALAFEDVDYVGHMHAVQCNKCGVITEYYENSTMAIEHWNRRAEEVKWRSVNDELPSDSGEKLVYCGEDNYCDIAHYNPAITITLIDNGNDVQHWYCSGKVTHWMPLPTPPGKD